MHWGTGTASQTANKHSLYNFIKKEAELADTSAVWLGSEELITSTRIVVGILITSGH